MAAPTTSAWHARIIPLMLAGVCAVGCAQVEPVPVAGYPAPAGAFPPQAGVPGFPGPMAPQPGPMAPGGMAAISPRFGAPAGEVAANRISNPLKVPVQNHDFAWDQIVDVVSAYFPITRQQRAMFDGNIWTEGVIETPYQIGATTFEPQRLDTVGTFNNWQSTLQTIRRRALVRVIPGPDGYAIDVRVDKELEDLPHPENATAGTASFRTDNSLPAVGREEVDRFEASQHWIALGRDVPLEQDILECIQSRLAAMPSVPMSVTPVR